MAQLVPVLSGSLVFSVLLSWSAYQQVGAKWWKWPSVAIAILSFGLLIMFVATYPDRPHPNHYVVTLWRAAFIWASAGFIGSLSALPLRPYLSGKAIAAVVWIVGFTLCCALLSRVDFT
jgi:hypothetical protein